MMQKPLNLLTMVLQDLAGGRMWLDANLHDLM